jgi:hypothetical protein
MIPSMICTKNTNMSSLRSTLLWMIADLQAGQVVIARKKVKIPLVLLFMYC